MDFDFTAGLPGKTLIGSGGERLGIIDSVFGEAVTFAAVRVAASGAKSFVPMVKATPSADDSITVPYSIALVQEAIELVKAAQTGESGGELEPDDEERLSLHYGIGAYGITNYRIATGPDPTDGDTAGVDPGDTDRFGVDPGDHD